MNEPTRANEGMFGKDQNPEAAPDVNDPWVRLEAWLDEDPDNNVAEVQKTRRTQTPDRRWSVRLIQYCDRSEENLLGQRSVADVESATLEGAVAGALLLAREFKEGL